MKENDVPATQTLIEQKPNFSICYRASIAFKRIFLASVFNGSIVLGGLLLKANEKADSNSTKGMGYGLGILFVTIGGLGNVYIVNEARKQCRACNRVSNLITHHQSIFGNVNPINLTQALLSNSPEEDEENQRTGNLELQNL